MRNMILFIVGALLLGFGGYFGYQVLIEGKDPEAVLTSLFGQSGQLSYYKQASKARIAGNYEKAAQYYSDALDAHKARAQGMVLNEQNLELAYRFKGTCYYKAWEQSSSKDPELRTKALHAMEEFIQRYPKATDIHKVKRDLNELKAWVPD